MSEIRKEAFIDLAGGRIRCRRCQALSKRSREQCKKPADHAQDRLRPVHLAPETLLAASNAATLAVGSVMGVMPNRVVDVPLVAAQG